MEFCLEKNQYIVIYGYTERGINVKKILQKEGFSNLLFIDQRVVDSTDDIVMSFLEFRSVYGDENRENVTIFISLQNAVEHQNIAEKFFENGYSKIIFLPANPRCNEKNAAVMRCYYNKLIRGIVHLTERIPDYREIVEETALFINRGLIEDENDYVKLWMHFSNIFVNKSQTHVIDLHKEYYGKCLAVVDHYQAIFTYFEKGEESKALEKYISAQGYMNSDGSFLMDKIEDRYKLWCLYKDELNRGMSFFISSAPEVIANEQGGFNICDGLHRAIFLFMKGFSYLPVKMKKELFYQKYDDCKLVKIREFIKKQNMTSTITPIEHPAFYHFPHKVEYREMDNLVSIQKYLGTTDLSEFSFLDWGGCECYYARNMRKMLENVNPGQIAGVVSTEVEMQFMKLLLEILGIKDVQLWMEYQAEHIFSVIYDIVYVTGKKFSEYSNLFKSYSENSAWLLFLESGDQEFKKNKKAIMKQGRFDRYNVLRKYYAEHETRVLAVFEKGAKLDS